MHAFLVTLHCANQFVRNQSRVKTDRVEVVRIRGDIAVWIHLHSETFSETAARTNNGVVVLIRAARQRRQIERVTRR